MFVFKTVGGKARIKETDSLATQARILRWPGGVRCLDYCETGRQRWENDTIDISSDLTGICNGQPCPADPIQDGDLSLCFAVDDAAQIRRFCPPSAYTGGMRRMIQAILGSKRTDLSYSFGGEISIAGVLFGHSYTNSSILYTDADGAYWVLAINVMAGATLQRWAPCKEVTFATGSVKQAYELALAKPKHDPVALSCTGAIYGAGYSIANGWHATNQGDIGHIVLHGGTYGEDHDYRGSKLCRYELADSAEAQEPGESWEDYIARRFALTFSIIEQAENILEGIAIPVAGPTTSEEPEAEGKLKFLDTAAPAGVMYPEHAATDAPFYCRYTDDDTLDVVRFTQVIGEARSLEAPAPGCDDCLTDGDIAGGQFSHLSFGPVSAFASEDDLGTISLAEGYNYVGSDGDWNGGTWEGLSDHEQAISWTESRIGPPPFTDTCGHEGDEHTNYFWQTTYFTDSHQKKHIFIVPEGNHESFLILELDIQRKQANTGAHNTGIDLGIKDWIHYTRRLYYFPDDGEDQLLDEIEHEEGEDYSGSFDCLVGVVGVQDELTPIDETEIYTDLALGQYLTLPVYKWPTTLYVDMISDRESVNLGHRNSWFVPDQSIERHDGYDNIVADGVFTGAS